MIALPAADIFAVRANAHYTYIHDGQQEYFCSLSISAVEARLDKKRFRRVHRSHIVAVDRITRIKRDGENGIAELGAPSVQCSIPIARGQLREVKAPGSKPRQADQTALCRRQCVSVAAAVRAESRQLAPFSRRPRLESLRVRRSIRDPSLKRLKSGLVGREERIKGRPA